MVDTNITAGVPLLLAPDALEDYGRGRKCVECKTERVNRYSSEPICFACFDKNVDKGLEAALVEAELKGIALHLDTKLYNLRLYRLKVGLSQRELAKYVGANSQYLSQIERQTRGCGKLLSQRLARALGVTVTELRGTNGDA